jgi:hypothetical protein
MLHLLAIPWAWVSDINIMKSKINLQSEKKVLVHAWEKGKNRLERAAKWMRSASSYNKIWKWT